MFEVCDGALDGGAGLAERSVERGELRISNASSGDSGQLARGSG